MAGGVGGYLLNSKQFISKKWVYGGAEGLRLRSLRNWYRDAKTGGVEAAKR
jgi:hypothetical protein